MSRVQLQHVLLDVDFFDKPTIRALEYKHSQLAVLLFIRWMMLMSRATNALVTRDALASVAREVLHNVPTNTATFEKVLDYCITNGMVIEESPGKFTNSRVVKDQESCAVKRESSAERQKKHREKLKGNSNALVTRLPDTDTVTDIDLKNNRSPEFGHLPEPERVKHEQADLMLVPVTDSSLAGSSQFINAGRRPMRKFPEIWLTPQELVLVLDEFMALNIEKRHKSAIFQRVAARIRTKVGSGLSAERVPAFNWLTGFELTNALQAIKAENDMKRSEKYLINAKEL